MPFTFSWRGRTSEENMPSGLDDYPRAHHVNEGYEIHLDLQSWMVEFSAFMASFASLAKDGPKQAVYQANSERIKEQLQQKLYNGNAELYCDYVGLQWAPKHQANGQLAEPIEWRPDGACGKAFESSLKLPARCNQPYT